MLTEQDVRNLLVQKAENKNLDYKQSMNWKVAATREKGGIVKDVLAMSNTQEGGRIVFGVRDGDFAAVGLGEGDFRSFDATRFADFVNCYADPPLECVIYKLVIDGRLFIAIEIPEFDDVPLICKADLNDESNRQILKRGAIYVRTTRAASEIVSTAEVMRDLIDRAMLKRGNRFLKMFDRIVEMQTSKVVAMQTVEMQTFAMHTVEKNQSLEAELERSYDLLLQTLGEALDLREGSPEGHSRRVTAFTMAIAHALGLSKDEVAIIARGAFLHDIGKMSIRDKILHKPSRLTAAEAAVMREHPRKGYEMVSKIPFLSSASEIVYSHHERYDGKGYPQGLRGTEIPLGARIVAVANALDSMITDLPFRSARPLTEARAEIQRWSGRQFDPEIVSIFETMPDEIFLELRRALDEHVQQ